MMVLQTIYRQKQPKTVNTYSTAKTYRLIPLRMELMIPAKKIGDEHKPVPQLDQKLKYTLCMLNA